MEFMMLSLVCALVGALNANKIRYCHWKSNISLGAALAGQTDIDFLVDRKDASRFRAILGGMDFRPAIPTTGASFPATEHYYGLDEESGVLAHVHAYFRVVTGESLTKNYRLPIEEMLLQHTREVDAVPAPEKHAELVVFTLRRMLKHTSLVELALVARDRKEARSEIDWLLQEDSIVPALQLVERWLPSVDKALFSECIASLKSADTLTTIWHRITLAHRLRAQLRLYARHLGIGPSLAGFRTFLAMFVGRVTGSRKGMAPQSGGAVIAFVGPEATGKSTTVSGIHAWLGEHFVVRQIHAGKPKSTLLTVIPNLLLPALRSLLPIYRSGSVETQYLASSQTKSPNTVYPLAFAIRSVLLAYDRWSLLTDAYRAASNGTLVLCDRYPSLCPGAADSPQLSHLPIEANRYPVRRALARIEQHLYRQIPPADVIIRLAVPVEIALQRNQTRGKREPEDYVRLRHAQSSSLDFGEVPVIEISTEQPFDTTIRVVKKAIWEACS
jgi:thymidylate kinase